MTLLSAVRRLLNERPIGFVDIGARGGAHPLVQDIAPAVAVLGFEPDAAETARMLADPITRGQYARFEIESVGLADRSGTATLYELTAPTNSSLLPPNATFVERYGMAKWDEVDRASVPITTLDEVLHAKRNSVVDWGEAIKIDTQGTEYEILEGARRTLIERAAFLCLEVSFCELYRGQKLFADIECFLRQFGFSFYGFDRIYCRSRKTLDKRRQWGRERIIQADAYFFKDPFDLQKTADRATDRRTRAISAVFALLSGYHDFALELLETLTPDSDLLREEVLRKAALPPANAASDVISLLGSINADPNNANVIVGKFVDRHRSLNDYYDIQ